MNGVQHHHPVRRLRGVVGQLTGAVLAAPHAKGATSMPDRRILRRLGRGVGVAAMTGRRGSGHYFISSMMALSVSGIGGIGARPMRISPSGPLCAVKLTVA